MARIAELREMVDEELEARLTEYRRELLNLRFQLATGQLDDVSRVKIARNDVARALTVLRERELGIEGEIASREVGGSEPRTRGEPRVSRARAAAEVEMSGELIDDEEAPIDAIDELDDAVDDQDDLDETGDVGAEIVRANGEEEEE